MQDANLWDVSSAPTIVMTQRGARRDFQAHLLARGVEVVQFDFLTPHAVAAYCSERGFLQCLWECGGTLAAPAIAGGVIHKCLAFVAPKLVRFPVSVPFQQDWSATVRLKMSTLEHASSGWVACTPNS
jgi:diaminohydroxyphosphoribosylaminopyrimidine deaminase/5-amino-6-(5-phosphoribosylamino)uracil reductase